MKQWSTRELRYLEEHAGDGAKQVAKDLGRSIDSVKHMAQKCGLSLRKRRQCPRCGQFRAGVMVGFLAALMIFLAVLWLWVIPTMDQAVADAQRAVGSMAVLNA